MYCWGDGVGHRGHTAYLVNLVILHVHVCWYNVCVCVCVCVCVWVGVWVGVGVGVCVCGWVGGCGCVYVAFP